MLRGVSRNMLFFHHPSSLCHDPAALSPDHPDSPERIAAIEAAVADGGGEAESIAPDPIVTPRVASHFGHVWVL
jgi:hypothetical protein